MLKRRLSIFGSTGSIGTNTLSLVDEAPDRFSIHALIAGNNHRLLAEQALKYKPDVVGLADKAGFDALKTALADTGIRIVGGAEACDEIAREPVDLVVAAITGLAGLGSVMAAVSAGQTLALANKESLVSAGEIVMQTAARTGARILPLDSEHNAIFQCWAGWQGREGTADRVGTTSIRHNCLTASGGPFRKTPLGEFLTITPEQAIKHPQWTMGRKISVDSATMMNKGLEIIEAHWLFDIAPENIEVLVHPQVAVHGLVYFRDGSVIGQLGTPDMRTPISYALEWPDRMLWDPEPLDLVALGRLEFHEVDPERYPCFTLARQALAAGGIMPAVLNAANEVAVDAFLSHQIGFNAISDVVNDVMQADIVGDVKSHAAVVALDAEARKEADACVRKYASD